MCLKLESGMIVCGLRVKWKFCACGRAADLLCDWKVRDKKSGTCDLSICSKHAQQVGPDKHLCPLHQKAWEDWKRRHSGAVPLPDYQQLSLL
jgi:hypothetical protein